MKACFFTLSLLFSVFFLAFGQSSGVDIPSFSTDRVSLPNSEVLQKNFAEAFLYQIDVPAIYGYVQKQGEASAIFQLNFPDNPTPPWSVHPFDIRSEDYIATLKTATGEQILDRPANVTYRGFVKNTQGGEVRLTLDENFLYGMWEQEGENWFIEPLYILVPGSPVDQYLVYRESKVIQASESLCGVGERTRHTESLLQTAKSQEKNTDGCFIIPIALAADYSVRSNAGGVTQAINFMLGVFNNVQTNFDNEFDNELQLEIVTNYVVDCSFCDPWTADTDGTNLLSSFRNWGNSGGFGNVSFAAASCWTERDFDGTAIGWAYVGGVCNSLKYNVLQHFSNSAAFLRVLQAHELGHNFGSFHDEVGSFTIMGPNVTASMVWSPESVDKINNRIELYGSSSSCFSTCSPAIVPVTAFRSSATHVCRNSTVAFFDQSSNTPDSWLWSFPGGTPSSSLKQNPTVVYKNSGTYPVTLNVSNAAGGDVLTKTSYISVGSSALRYLFYDTFEQGFGQWQIDNPGSGISWEFALVGGTNGGRRALMVDNYNYDYDIGAIDGLVSSIWDFSEETGMTLSFDYAYQRYDSSRVDQFRVLVSTDGGDTYPHLLFSGIEDGSGNFATVLESDQFFIPVATNDWCFGTDSIGMSCISLDLSAFSGESEVRIRIENETGNGNNIYVDNIRLYVDCIPVTAPVAVAGSNIRIGCAPHSVTFRDLTEEVVQSRQWTFPGGTPATSEAKFPYVTYNTPGLYDVSLEVFNSAGSDILEKEDWVKILGPPVVSFTQQITENEVVFENLTTEADTYLWDFGDESTSTLPNPIHSYNLPGEYTVLLSATNNCGTATQEFSITIDPFVRASFTADQTQGCTPMTVQFMDTSEGDVDNWLWTFEGGTPATSSERNPTVLYDQQGVYSVSLVTADGDIEGTVVQENYISVGQAPTAGFTIEYMPNQNRANFTSTVENFDSITWNFGEFFGEDISYIGGPDFANIYMDYYTPGTYVVQQIVRNECGADTLNQDVVISLPTISFEQTASCAPVSVSFEVDDPQADYHYYLWAYSDESFNTVVEGSGSTGTFQFPNRGEFDFYIDILDTFLLPIVSIYYPGIVIVEDVPEIAFGYDYNLGESSATFYIENTYADSLYWQFPDGNIASGDSIMYDFQESGMYQVSLIGINSCGTDTSQQIIEILTPSIVDFTATQTSGCAPIEITFSAVQPQPTNTYYWSFPGGSPATGEGSEVVVTYDYAGSYSASLTVTNALGDSTLTRNEYIVLGNAPTIPGLTVDYDPLPGTIHLTASTYYTDSIYWDFGDGQFSGEESPSHTYSTQGYYTITLTAFNDCTSTSRSIVRYIELPPIAGFVADVTEGCAPLEVNFVADPQHQRYNYEWTFNGSFTFPSSPFAEERSYTYSIPGAFDVALKVTNDFGESQIEKTDYITVFDEPESDFDHDKDHLVIYLTSDAEHADTYLWDFGDGQFSEEENPTHYYEESGTYTVSLTVSNACGMDTKEITTYIFDLSPNITYHANSQEGCAPHTVNFNNETVWADSYQWSFPGGTPETSTEKSPQILYPAAGVYEATLIASNEYGSSTESKTIVVHSEPVAQFSITTSPDDPYTIELTNNSLFADTYRWTFGDGTGSFYDFEPTHTYSHSGTFQVRLFASNEECGFDLLTLYVTLEEIVLPQVHFSTDEYDACVPTTIQFNNTSMDADTYQWFFQGGNPSSSTEEHPIVTYAEGGLFDVTLIGFNENGSDTLYSPNKIWVYIFPDSDFSYTTDLLTVHFTNLSAFQGNSQWIFGDGQVIHNQNPTHTYAEAGTYEVSHVVVNGCASDTSTQLINVGDFSIQASFTAEQIMGCAPLMVYYFGSFEGPVDSIRWFFPGGDPAQSSDMNPSVVYHSPGPYDVQLYAANEQGTEQWLNEFDYVQVNDMPEIDSIDYTLDGGALSMVIWATGTDNNYQFDFGDGIVLSNQGVFNAFHIYQTEGVYPLVVTISNDCGSVQRTVEINVVINATQEPIWAGSLELYPNPTSDRIWLRLKEWVGSGEMNWRWYDARGALLQQGHWQIAGSSIEKSWNMTNMPSGMYYLELNWNGEKIYRRLVKQ